jgi:hypothetical protein
VRSAVTPEERLLRLIESGEPSGRSFALWDVRGWTAVFVPYQEKARRLVASWFSGRRVPRELNLQVINRGLVVLLVLVVAAIALNTRKTPPSSMDVSRPEGSVALPVKADQPSVALRPVEEYLKEIEGRDLFNPVAPPERKTADVRPEPVAPPAPVKPPEPTPHDLLRERVKTLKLVGIAWGPIPIAMIEDTTTKETSFVRERDSLNQIRIKVILRDRVVLGYGNAEYDLF